MQVHTCTELWAQSNPFIFYFIFFRVLGFSIDSIQQKNLKSKDKNYNTQSNSPNSKHTFHIPLTALTITPSRKANVKTQIQSNIISTLSHCDFEFFLFASHGLTLVSEPSTRCRPCCHRLLPSINNFFEVLALIN